MASGPPQVPVQPVLSERADIHKSCKSLETLVNAFNDYCEAINFVTGSQKRLVKTLRETAGLKATGEIAEKTLNASASIFEVMSEINIKFGEIADKEFDVMNSKLKNWFKKLAKEEKAHDEKMSTVNTRIKQAEGHSYETKSMKNAGDASEDHTRYPNLISAYGPEISQEKHNHALLVMQKHTLATNNVAACLSRIADTEWLRSCEEVRRFASKIGQLGQWRALCEGGWTRAIPRDLPSLYENPEQSSDPNSTQSDSYKRPLEFQDCRDPHTWTEQSQFDECASIKNPQDVRPLHIKTTTSSGEPFLSRKPSFASFLSAQQSNSSSPSKPNMASSPSKVLFAPSEKWADTVGSVTSLSSFPSPPSHVPDTASPTELDHKQSRPRPLPILMQSSSSPNSPRLPESPRPGSTEQASPENLTSSERPKSPRSPRSDLALPPILSLASSNIQDKDILGTGLGDITGTKTQTLGNSGQNVTPRNNLSRSATLQAVIRNWSPLTRNTSHAIEKSSPLNSSTSSARTSGSTTSKQDGEYVLDELGVGRSGGPSKPQNLVAVKEQGVERRGSTSSANSVVAAMGGRYGSPVTSSSKSTSQSSLSINELASRYQSASPQPQVGSPIGERQPRSFEIISPRPSRSQEDHGKIDLPSPSPSTGSDTEELNHRRGEQEASGKQGQDLKVQAPVDRQQEIEMRVRELEKSFDSPQPNDDPGTQLPRIRYSYSTTQLVSPVSPPPPSSFTSHPYVQSRGQASNLDHTPFCGCASCSAANYKARSTTPTPYDLRPKSPISLRPEKPRGWIRRITVPVGHAFSLDSKKSSSALKNGIMWSAAVGEDGRMRRSYEQGGNNSRSSTNLGRR